MVQRRILLDFMLANGDGLEQPFHEFLADFNILAIRRVPVPSHGPATELLRSLLAENRGAEDETVRGFDIRSPDRRCEKCHGPHIVFTGPDLATICDVDGSILQKFAVEGYDRFFVVRSGVKVIDVGSIEEISQSGMRLGLDGASSRNRIARAPLAPQHHAEPHRTVSNGRCETRRASK